MNASRLLAQVLRSMARYKMRSAFMMLGAFVGVAALVFVVSVGSGAEQKLLSTVQRLFSASSVLVTGGGNLIGGGPRGDSARLTLEDLSAIAAAVPAVDTWDPIQILDPAPARHGAASASVRLLGQSERAERVWERPATRGEYFSAGDVARAARVALIGATVERTLFAGEDPLDAEILLGGVSFRVVGVLEPMGTDVHGFDRDNEIVVPITTALRRVMNVDSVRGAKVLMKDAGQVDGAAREIARVLRERHSIGPGQADDFTIVTPVEVQKLVARVRQVLFLLLPLVAGIALLAGGVVCASLMLMSVSERTAEIGLRRAVGARARDVALQLIWETAATALSGGLMGVLCGGLGAYAVARRLGLQSYFSWKAALLAVALAALTGLAAGVAPARRAAAQHPAEALR